MFFLYIVPIYQTGEKIVNIGILDLGAEDTVDIRIGVFSRSDKRKEKGCICNL